MDRGAKIKLVSCNASTMASYLKSLGAFSTLAASRDSQMRASWDDSCMTLHLDTDKDPVKEDIVDRIYHTYEPTPVVTPWNGGGGFMTGSDKAGKILRSVEKSDHGQLRTYAATIQKTREILSLLRYKGVSLTDEKDSIRPEIKNLKGGEGKFVKVIILKACRNYLPDAAVSALDSMYALTTTKPGYNPLLGSGGNDGRLEFIDNFRQNLLRALVDSDEETSKKWVEGSLFGNNEKMVNSAIGQFDPGSMFGPNMTTLDDDGTSLINPWDYILMIEGAIMFAGGVTRHLAAESRTRASFPFIVDSSNAGYGTSGGDEKTRGEIWAPIWDRPATLKEIRHVFSEGRAQMGGRRATRGSDVARAIITLGTERGLSHFYRFGIHERNGRSNIILPMGRVTASRHPRGLVLAELDEWLDKARQVKNPPATIRARLRAVESAIFGVAEAGDDGDMPGVMQKVLISVGELEMALAKSYSASNDYSNPFPLRRITAEWIKLCYDHTPEFRLASSLASITGRGDVERIRTNIEPVFYNNKGFVRWLDGSVAVVPRVGHFGRYVSAILQRRMIDAARTGAKYAPTHGSVKAPLPDVIRMLHGELDLEKILKLFVPLSLVEYGSERHTWEKEIWERDVRVPYSFAVLRMVFLDSDFEERHIRYETSIANLLDADRLGDAIDIAQRRLFASGVESIVPDGGGNRVAAGVPSSMATGMASSLLFPIADYDVKELHRAIGGQSLNSCKVPWSLTTNQY